jgi:monoamine oxidase
LAKAPDEPGSDVSAHEWLASLGQSEEGIRDFWNILILAIFNQPAERAPAVLLRRVLQEAFFSGRRGSCIGIPRVDLGHLWAGAADRFLRARRGKILYGEPVRRLLADGKKIAGLELWSGEIVNGDGCISAVPPPLLAKIVPRSPAPEADPLRRLEEFTTSPILTILIWTSKRLLETGFTALLHSPVHWVFQKEGYVSLVISGNRDFTAWPEEKLIEMAGNELQKFFPGFTGGDIQRGRVIKERGATYIPPESKEALRPGPGTPFENLFLAGDWTDTGLPCTLEGAVRSGRRSAGALIRRFGETIES